MIKKTAFILAIIFLLISINSCYFDRDINDELEISFVRGGSIWKMGIDGSNQINITNSFFDTYASWSPDGETIVFRSNRDSNNDIYVVNADGSELKQQTFTLNPDGNHFPTWTSDGNKIIFTEFKSGINYIHIANNEGTILKSFTTNADPVEGLSTSPDGKYIYCNRATSLYRIDIASGTQTDLSFNPGEFSISPDGKNIAFSDGQINIYNIDTGISKLFTTGSSPCWTPDGKTIIFVSTDYNIWSMDIDQTNQKPLTFSGGCSYPCVKWKPI